MRKFRKFWRALGSAIKAFRREFHARMNPAPRRRKPPIAPPYRGPTLIGKAIE